MLPNRNRSLESGYRQARIDDETRHVVLGGIQHGLDPDRHDRVSYDRLIINVVLRSVGWYEDASGSRSALAPGTLFHRYPNAIHSTGYQPESDAAEIWLIFDPVTSKDLMSMGLVNREPVLDVGDPTIIFEEFRRLCLRTDVPWSQLPWHMLLSEVLAFLDALYRRAWRNQGAISRNHWSKTVASACQLLEHRLEDRTRVEQIIRRLGVSYSAFRLHFKRATGLSPGDSAASKRRSACS